MLFIAASVACWQHTQKRKYLLPSSQLCALDVKDEVDNRKHLQISSDRPLSICSEKTHGAAISGTELQSLNVRVFTCTTGKAQLNSPWKILIWFIACPMLWDKASPLCQHQNYRNLFFPESPSVVHGLLLWVDHLLLTAAACNFHQRLWAALLRKAKGPPQSNRWWSRRASQTLQRSQASLPLRERPQVSVFLS